MNTALLAALWGQADIELVGAMALKASPGPVADAAAVDLVHNMLSPPITRTHEG